MNVMATAPVGTTAQVFGAAKINADPIAKTLVEGVMKYPEVVKAVKTARPGTEINIVQAYNGNLKALTKGKPESNPASFPPPTDTFVVGIKAPGAEKNKTLSTFWSTNDLKDEESMKYNAQELLEALYGPNVHEIAVA